MTVLKFRASFGFPDGRRSPRVPPPPDSIADNSLHRDDGAPDPGLAGASAEKNRMIHIRDLILPVAIFAGLGLSTALAEDAFQVKVSLKDHRFVPAEPTAPAGRPIMMEVTNADSTPSEFESKTLRVEKLVPGGGTISLRVRSLPPGRYRFYDDYHEETTQGFLVVK